MKMKNCETTILTPLCANAMLHINYLQNNNFNDNIDTNVINIEKKDKIQSSNISLKSALLSALSSLRYLVLCSITIARLYDREAIMIYRISYLTLLSSLLFLTLLSSLLFLRNTPRYGTREAIMIYRISYLTLLSSLLFLTLLPHSYSSEIHHDMELERFSLSLEA
jgi:hypothetical protein